MIEDDTYIIQGPPPLKPIPDTSIGKLIYSKLSAEFGDEAAFIDANSGKFISYKELFAKTCSLAISLRKLGYGKNSIISICSENCNEFFIPVIAALLIGAIIAPINHNYTELEMVHALNISQPSIVFCSKEVLSKLLELKKKQTFIKRIIAINNDTNINGVESLNNFTNENFALPLDEIAEVQPREQVAFILCSSGTTGLPKGVMLTHRNISTSFIHTDDPRMFNQESGRCTLGVLPFFHSYGILRSLNSIQKGIQIIVMKKFTEEVFLRSIEKYKITFLSLVPPLAILLAKSPLVDKYDLSSVVEVICGAAPLSKSTEEVLKRRLKIKSVQQAYGLTETTLRVMSIPYGQQRFGSSGKMCPYMSCKIRDPETGKSLGPNKIGELCFKGPSIMKGYYNNEEANKNAFTSDGWLLTGDLGYYDDEEYFYIVDRLKELIKYKGFQVPPAELEALLLTNPKIKDVGVVGVADEDAGELPLAFVVVNPNVNLTEDEVKQFVAERVSPHKWLRGGVVFLEEIPKNPSGKILRRKLKELLTKYKSKL